MPIEFLPINRIDANPYNPRQYEAPEHVAELATDIQARGLLQVPRGRRVKERVQLSFGHSRLAAWKIANPGKPFPVDVVELTDQQMAAEAFSENVKRGDLTQIEKARFLQRYMTDFKVSQKDMATAFGYDPASISNLLRLLRLPAPVQALMLGANPLPERLARQLVGIGEARPDDALTIAQAVRKADEDEREQRLHHLLWEYFNHQRDLRLGTFPKDWKPEPGQPLADGLSPEQPVACQGCRFNVTYQRDDHCLRPACWEAKKVQWQARAAARAAEKTKVPVAAPEDLKGAVLVNAGWDPNGLKRVVKSKAPELRIAPLSSVPAGRAYQSDYARKEALGSDDVVLVATSAEAAKRLEKQFSRNGHSSQPDARQKREREQRKEVTALVNAAADQLAPALFPPAVPDATMELLAEQLLWKYKGGHDAGVAAFKADPRRAAAKILLREHTKTDSMYHSVKPETVRDRLSELAKALKVKLSAAPAAPSANGKAPAKESIDRQALSWLRHTPASDINFKTTLGRANRATCKAALQHKGLTQTARRRIQRRIARLGKE